MEDELPIPALHTTTQHVSYQSAATPDLVLDEEFKISAAD